VSSNKKPNVKRKDL